jgi:hypothetical protein
MFSVEVSCDPRQLPPAYTDGMWFMAAIDPRIESFYGLLADLDDRWDLSDSQKMTARAELLWSAVILKRRQTSLLADGQLLHYLELQVKRTEPSLPPKQRQRYGLD